MGSEKNIKVEFFVAWYKKLNYEIKNIPYTYLIPKSMLEK